MSNIAIILVTLVFSAFFSGMEIAFISANKLKLEMLKKQDSLSSRMINLFSLNPQQFIATLLVGNSITLAIYGVSFVRLLEPQLRLQFTSDTLILITQAIIASAVILITGEFIPKMLFRISPIGFLKTFILPVFFFYLLLYPIAKLTMILSRRKILTNFNPDYSDENGRVMFSKIDLDHYVNQNDTPEENNNSDEQTEITLFKNALDFSKVKVRECMIPRTEITAVDEETDIDELKKLFIETGFSKILIYNESIDNIIGYVHSSQMFRNPTSIKSIINTISIVPETISASNLLSLFTQKRKTIAVVVDEFGGTSGIVTTEDILEEIFGEIEDEHDTDDLTFKKIKENEWILSARHEISFLNEKYGFNLPDDDSYDTIAGLIISKHENIPKTNTIITVENFEFRILKASYIRIELVLMKIIEMN